MIEPLDLEKLSTYTITRIGGEVGTSCIDLIVDKINEIIETLNKEEG